MRCTIGMAMADDFDGVYFTIQHIRQNMLSAEKLYKEGYLTAPWAGVDRLKDTEFIVVDNRPAKNNAHSNEAKFFVTEKISQQLNLNCRYIPMGDPQGTSPPRNRVFKEAAGDVVWCMDCHILPQFGAIEAGMLYFEQNPNSRDLLCGPLIYDDLQVTNTHFDDFWRGGMWGIWGGAWQCPCSSTGIKFTPHKLDKNLPWAAHLLAMGCPIVTECHCGRAIPSDLNSSNLKIKGYRQLAANDGDEPFEIPGQGLWMFACRREAWLGFNENFRGFGGEEMYYHEKLRQAGGKTICHPMLKGVHRFASIYRRWSPSDWGKVRNYTIGLEEIGLPLDRLQEHFQHELKKIDQAGWDYLQEDPVAHTEPKNDPKKIADTAAGRPVPEGDDTLSLDAMFAWVKKTPRDMEKHADVLKSHAAKCKTGLSIVKRREWDIVLLAAGLEKLTSYTSEFNQPVYDTLQILASDRINVTPILVSSPVPVPDEPVDMLLIDSKHTYPLLKEQLESFSPKVSRFIFMRGTSPQGNGNKGEDGTEPGLLQAIREFLEAHEDWFPIYHSDSQYGFSIIGHMDEDKPERVHPSLLGGGPGTELEALLKECSIEPVDGCDCKAKARNMDLWGVEGCRKKFNQIVGELKDGATRWKFEDRTWNEKFKIARGVLKSGIWKKVNWSDPFPGLVTEAIARAEEKQAVRIKKKESAK